MPRNDGLHTTTHEKQYINGLGTWSEKHPSISRTGFLLKKYLSSCKFRNNWGDINKEKCVSHAVKRLKDLYE